MIAVRGLRYLELDTTLYMSNVPGVVRVNVIFSDFHINKNRQE